MSKIKNCFVSGCHNKKDTIKSSCFGLAPLLIFQLLIALLIVQPNAWAGLLSLSVDANGDNVFNGKDDGEKLTISFTTSDFGDAPDESGQGGQQYTYKILVDYLGDKTIAIGPGAGNVLSKNQTIEFVWDGMYFKDGDSGDRQKLPDGDYTITVKLTNSNDTPLPSDQVAERTAQVTLDTKAPEVNISIDADAFSPILYSLPVYYDIDEDVSEAWLEFQRAPGNANIGRRVPLSTTSGSHTYNWYGDDNNRRSFLDGQYTLRIRVKDKGGNAAETGKTGNITIDTEEPRITSITLNDSIPLTNGKFVNASITTINFTANDPDGTGVNLTGRDTEVLIRPVGGRNLNGTMTIGNKATFTLGDALDALEENGEYEVTAFISDNVGNLASSRVRFTFDNTVPILKSVATHSGEFTAGSGISGLTNYVEATLEDNLELNLADSTIKLKGPSDSDILGQQVRPADDKIRWQLLAPLLAEDGIHDGQYTVEVVGADKAGNKTTPIQITFLFDNLAPELVSVKPTRDGEPFNILGDTVYYNLPLNQFVATFDDGEFGTGVVLSGTETISHIAFGTPNTDGSINIMSGRAFPDENNNVLTYILDAPILNRDGSQDGNYRLDVVATDALGNSKSYSYNLIYDTQVPTLTSTVPGANESVKDLSQVVVKLDETTSGIDFLQSTFALKRNVDGNQVEVPVGITSNGTDTATLTLLQPIALDGSDDGTYTIEVTPTDRAGNVGSVIRREFYLVSQARPKIKLTTPQTGTVNSLADITVQLVDYIGTGINFDASTVTVRNAQGQFVPQAEVVSDPTNNSLTWSTEAAIPQNGSADGRYTISASFRDYTGVSFTQTFYLSLDTQFPAISSVQVGTDAQHQLSLDSITDVTDSFSHINVEFDASDADFENTVVTLAGPDGNEIAVRRTNDGAGTLTLNFQNLATLGTYTLTVTPIDNIGNVPESPFIYRFNLDIAVPVVTSVIIGGQIGGLVYVNDTATEIVATLADTTGIGIAVGDNESKIAVTTEIGLPVPGITTINDENQLTWRPAVLPSDGSADGRYTVSVTPVDKAGRTGDVAYRAFIYDTQSPRITTASPITLHQPISYVGDSLTQFQFSIEDIGPALLDLDDQTISFAKNSGEIVTGHITHDNNNQLFFTLSTPLPTDGSADGEYTLTVDLVDKAGNPYQVSHNILYDSQVPQLSSVTLSTEPPINLVPYQVVDLSESISKITLNFIEMTRVDFANTTITLMRPDGATTPLTLENNGIDEITANFVSLTQGGLYTLSVVPQDIAGNVAQGGVQYPFELKFEVPVLTAVRANSVASSYELTSYEIADISDVISSLILEFTDAMRVDFENTRITLTAPNEQEISVLQEEIDGNQLMVRFIALTQSGLYTLSVTPQDIAGNVAQSPMRYQFRLDISLPAVGSVHIDGKPGTNILTNNPGINIVATFVDATGVGLAFSDEGSNITVTNEQGLVVSGNTSTTATNQLTWIPAALPADGSADGRYTVTITPVDKSGRSGTVVNRHFIYDTQAPRITSSIPIMIHQPMSYIGGTLTQFQFTVEDIGPALLDLDDQTIELKKKDGEVVLGHVTHDGANQLFFTLASPLPTDGSADGEYTLTTYIIDKAGNSIEDKHNIYYDSQVPRLSSVSLNTETPTLLNPYEVTDLSEAVNQLTLEFTETTRVDFAATVITLTGPNNSPIPLTLENNGVDQISASFVTLTQDGLYTLSVTPQDIAGNVAQGAVQYPFQLKFDVPGLAAVTANAADNSIELIQHEIAETSIYIDSFTLEFTDPQRVNFENTEVILRGLDGQELLVTLERNDANQLMVRFVPLEQSGLYTLSVTPQDIHGTVAQNAVSYQFRLEFDMPRLASVKANTADTSLELTPYEIVELSEPVGGFTLEFTDPQRVDFENTGVVLRGPDGQELLVTLEHNDANQLMVRFVPLEQSGLYTLSVTPQDIHGTVAQNAVSYQFRLEFDMPRLASVKANTADTSLELTPYEIVELSEPVGGFTLEFTDPQRVDFENTEVVLRGPDGQELLVTLEHNDANQLMVRFVPLEQSGLYTLSVTPQDIHGTVAQNPVSYQFRLEFDMPRLASVKANTADTSLELTPYEIVELSEPVGGFTLEFTDGSRVDFENTRVVLTGPNEQEVPTTLEDDDDATLFVKFVSLEQSGLYTLSVTPQDIHGTVAQDTVSYQFRLEFDMSRLASVKANTADTSLELTPYEIVELSEPVGGFTLEFTDPQRVDFENTGVVLRGPDGQELLVTLEHNDADQLMVRFVPLEQSGLYTLSVTPQDIHGTVAQNAVSYQFRLEFDMPRLASVKANTADTSLDLTPYEIVELSEPIGGFTLEFTDGSRVDFENTRVVLTGPNEQQVPITLENDDDATLFVKFVSLDQTGLYTLSVTPQDIHGTVAQDAVSYQFRLEFDMPRLASVKANTADTSLELTPYEIVELSEPVGGFTLEFTDPQRVDFENTGVVLRGPDGQELLVTLEHNDADQLMVRFVPLEQSGLYTLSVTPQDIHGTVAQDAVSYQFRLEFDMPRLASVKANTADTSLELTPYEIVELSESIGGFTLEFTDGSRVDFENTRVVLTGPNEQQVPITLENDDHATLFVKFVSLEQSGLYTLSVTPQDIHGTVAQDAVSYQFRLEFDMPRLASVKANTADTSLELTPYEIAELSEPVGGFTLEFTEPQRVDFENTEVVLRGPDGQEILATLEHNDANQLMVRFVPLEQSGTYTLSVTPQDIHGTVAQNPVSYQFGLEFDMPRLASVKANTADTSLELTPYEITELSEPVGGFTLEFTDPQRVDFENTEVVLRGPDGQELLVTLEHNDANQLMVRFVPLEQSGTYTLSVTPQDIHGTVAQDPMSYQFRLEFDMPRLASVKANTADTSLELTPYEITELSEPVGGFTLEFTDGSRVDFENTRVVLTGPNEQQVPITLENDDDATLFVKFVSLDQTGLYTLSVAPQDIDGTVAQNAVSYQFRLEFDMPRLASVKANTADTFLELTPYEITELSEPVGGFTLEFTDPQRVDFENTEVVLRGPDGQELLVTLEHNDANQLMVRFVPLEQSGTYTLSVTPQDIHGTVAQNAVSYQFRLEFDMPRLASVKANIADTSLELTPYEIVELSEPVGGFTLEFADGSRVDFENTRVVLTGPNEQQVPITLENDDDATLFVKFVSLDQTGLYTLSVTPQDIHGTVAQNAVLYQFRLEFDIPRLASVKANIADTSLDLTPYEITELSEPVGGFTLEFTDPQRVDFENTEVVLRGPDGQELLVTLEHNDADQLMVRFVPLEQSGTYTLSVTPQDRSGNVAQKAVSYQFRLEFDMPRLASVKANTADTSLDLTPYEIVEISEPVGGFTLKFTDGSRVDFENTRVVLTGPNEQQVPITLENDDDATLFVKFVSLEQTGLYTLSVTPQDIHGTVAQNAVSYQFRLKFEVPGLESVTANTDDTSVALIQHDIVEISESVGSLTLKFADTQRVDFENTSVTLTGPNNQEILVTLEDNENAQLTVRFVPLTQSGIYTLSVTPQDIAGNVAQTAIRYQFRLDTTLPSVNAVLIDGKVGATVYVRSAVPRIIANITDSIGVGVADGEGGSSIVVTNSQNIEVSGTTTFNGTNQLTWIPTPLPVDGSADGQYTVVITPVDKSGRTGTAVRRQFIYDTQAPRITSATPIILHAPISYIGGGLNQFVLTVEDVGPADIVFASQVVALMDATDKQIPSKLTYDEITNQLYLSLDTPFASDGTADGPYTLNVLLVDKAGNRLSTQYDLVYDSKIPEVSTVQVNTAGTPMDLTPNQVAELTESIDTITIKFTETTRVDFENTNVSLLDPNDQTIPLTVGDDGVAQMTLSFVALTQIGQYTLTITPQDIAGNAAQSPIQYAFNLEFILPDVASVIIGDTVTLGSAHTVYVNAENLVIVVNLLDPSGTGLSFDTTTGSEIIVATLDNFVVPGSTATNGTDVLVWRPTTLSNDGSSDGRYAVYVYPVDKKGREGVTVYREFIYDTQEPEITSASPIDLSQPVTYISESLTQFQFTIQDVGLSDLVLEDQEVSLRNENGVLIPTKLTNDKNNQLFLTLDEPLPLDGSRDGEYTVEIAFSDRAGNVLSINHPIVYDTQAPTLVSTVPADSEQLTEDITQIQVNLDDKGDSGIDWSRTTVTLIDPNGNVISGDLSSDGKSRLTLKTNQLVADGRYIIQVQAIDRAGNGSQSVHESDFLLSRRLPAIVSTVPITAPEDEAYTNEVVEEIEVLLKTVDVRHLSTVRLLTSEGQVVAGQQHRETGKLIYRLVRPLATDGSEDGDYTIEFTPISSSGRSGAAQSLTFTYDTQSPELDPKDVHLIVAEPQVDNSLVRIRLDITDNHAGVDWENLDIDWVTFERISPDPTEIKGSVLDVLEEPSHLIFTLNVPLADDGSADGKYKITVTPVDKAGNGEETYEKEFTYDTSPPVIDPNALLINDAPLLTDIDADDYPSAVSTTGGVAIQAIVSDTGLGVNLSQSRIIVANPNGQEISGTTRQNGVDTLVFKSDGLNVEGIYRVTIIATGNDTEQLGITPQGSVTVEFLYETTTPTAVVTDDGGKTELTDEALPLQGTAADPQGTRRAGPQGESEVPVPASGVWLVEIVGTGPDGQPIEPVPAEDDSDAEQEPWSRWKVDFLPTRSGEYDLDIRVTDKAGNYAVYDYGEVTMSVSFTFSGNTFVWPNPLRQSNDDVGFFSYELNTSDETVKMNLYIYDWGGDLVHSKTYDRIKSEHRNGNEVKWGLKNSAGNRVARGIYVFRLEAVDGAGNRANAVGKILVVD